jgi:hypothetical protein
MPASWSFFSGALSGETALLRAGRINQPAESHGAGAKYETTQAG